MDRMHNNEYWIRCILLIGILIPCGLGVTLIRMSCLGMEPFTGICYTLSRVFDCPMGYMTAGVNAVILIFTFIFLKTSLGPGTLIIMLELGYSCDFWNYIITGICGHEISFNGLEHLPLRIMLFCIGLCFMSVSTSFCLGADVGIAPYDTVGYIVEKVSKKRIPFRTARMVQDILVVIITFFSASAIGIQWQVIGIGTVILAFCIGPLLSFLTNQAAVPVIYKLTKKGASL